MIEEIQRHSEALAPRFDGYRRRALVIGLIGIAASVFGYLTDHQQFFQSYLLGFTYWVCMPLGCLGILMLHHLAGGRWGFAIRRILEAGACTIPVMFILGLPVLAGMHDLFEWTHTEVVAEDEVLSHKMPYLNSTFFIVRYVAYFVIWTVMATLLTRWSTTQDQIKETWPTRRMQRLSGPGMVLLALLGTFAGTDWLMSLEPHWFSTIFCAIYMIGMALMAWALAVLVGVPLSKHEPLNNLLTNERLRDLGTMMLGFVMLWAYTSFSQLLIIWSGNLPEEITWYYTRLSGGWLYLGYGLIGFHFAVPFLLLISSRIKARTQVLVAVAIGLLFMRLVDLYWITAPAFKSHEGGMLQTVALQPHWLDIAIPIGLGGLWVFFFFGQLKKRPLVPSNDPRFDYDALVAEAQESGHHG
ncbi:MAG: hypothetical protein HN712_14000 [Gemmatimonadetes bacterium]|jgi:hypothetical protein|nr:hypothetical protein [Gemmatimonadota bacterium]MBT7861431.1 hypothetical protein [Gemmatimonadota bacterium]